jgi:hypothetical protein
MMKNYYMSASVAGRNVVGAVNVSVDVFLEVQDKKYG